ncbi:MAG: MXAN_5808 family serine peptidase [Candidatus Brocadiales bacterium]
MLRKLIPKSRPVRLMCFFVFIFYIVVFGYNIASKGLLLEWSAERNFQKHRIPQIACSYIERFYVDPERIHPLEMLKEGLSWLERFVPEVMVEFTPSSDKALVTVNDKEMTFDISEVSSLDNAAWILKNILGFVQINMEDASINGDDIEYTAANGMLSQLDPHTVLFPPKDYTEFRIGTSGKFGGLGMVVGIREFILTVISPIDGTPAYKAGMKAGDKIIEIDGESTVNMTLFEAVGKLRGEPGSTVNISVIRKKMTEPKIVTLMREIIAIPSVDSKSMGKGIGYLKIRSFQSDTSRDLNKHIESLKADMGRIKGLIIDLRNNSGGLLDQAVAVADKFLSRGCIVMTVSSLRQQREITMAHALETDETGYPIAVIIDAGSASGAEIVAGALKENNRAIIIGDRSFGKGTVQQLIDLVDGSALKVTVAKYLTPLGTDIQSVGIIPDIELFPVIIKKDDIKLFKESYHSFREADLKQHFGEEKEIETPSEIIKYLYVTEEKKQEEKEEENAYKLPDFSNDFPVQFAKKLVSSSSSWNRLEILEHSSKKLLKDIEKTNRDDIVEALSAQDIDWSAGESSGVPEPTTRFVLDKSKVKAGDKVVLTVEVTNEGDAPLYRLWAATECKNPRFDKLEFILGKIEKGQTRSYSTTVELPQSAIDRKDAITIKFNELNGYTPKETSGTIITEALPRPQFAYSYQILDNGFNGYRGNNDGLIQKGESIELLLHITNIGKGTSTKNIVTLRDVSHKDIFIEQGKGEIGELSPGDSKTVTLRFTVKRSLADNEFSMKIVISDTTFGIFLSDKVTFDIAESIKTLETVKSDKTQTKSAIAALSTQRVPPSIELTQPASLSLLGLEKITLSGVVKDDKYVKHVYILVDNDKVFFKPNSPENKNASRLPFISEIPLKEGPNTITVVARDDLGLVVSKSFVVNSIPAVAKRTD